LSSHQEVKEQLRTRAEDKLHLPYKEFQDLSSNIFCLVPEAGLSLRRSVIFTREHVY